MFSQLSKEYGVDSTYITVYRDRHIPHEFVIWFDAWKVTGWELHTHMRMQRLMNKVESCVCFLMI